MSDDSSKLPLYSPAYWKVWKAGCDLDAGRNVETKKAVATKEPDWLVGSTLLKPGLHSPASATSIERNSKYRRTRDVDFGRDRRFSVDKKDPPNPFADVAVVPPYPVRGGVFSRTTRFDCAKAMISKHHKTTSGTTVEVGPGSYKTVGGIGISTNAYPSAASTSFGRALRPDTSLKMISPGPVYEPAMDIVKPSVQTSKFSQSRRGKIGKKTDLTPGPKYAPKYGQIGSGAAASFASPWAPKMEKPASPTGLRARGVSGFGYGCNLEEHIKYGQCLDGKCSERSTWEQSISLTQNEHDGTNAQGCRSSSESGAKTLKESMCSKYHESSALHYACAYGEVDVVVHLLDSGADLNATDPSNRTPMHIACSKGYLHIVMKLLAAPSWIDALKISRKPANLNIQDVDGCTCLHDASKNGHHYIVEKLLQGGVDATIEDKNSRTAAYYAANQKTYQVLENADVRTHKQRRAKWKKATVTVKNAHNFSRFAATSNMALAAPLGLQAKARQGGHAHGQHT